MRKLVALVAFLLAVSLLGAAQDYPRTELFGGYSYFHSSFGGTGLNFNGGSGSFNANLTPWVGLTADFGRYDNSHSGVSSTNFTYLFGPQFTYRGSDRFTPYFHILFGGSHLSSSFSTGISSSSDSSNAFALALGGGLDAKVSPHIAIRVAQIDYLLTKFRDDEDNRQNNVRISAGIVFRWGESHGGKK